MSIDPVPQFVPMNPYVIQISAGHMMVTTYIYSDGQATEEELDGAVTTLVDLLQGWPGRQPGADAQGQKYITTLQAVRPTNPDPVPDPGE